ncbi:hypothetical protein F5050DRAFT_1809393 [Lentinula boryana]|uniref:Uncharacterized protein n=1 Tax=Lentinula boryana TaxID=40481 RepID=A0ABQ8Q878_9AGAR|nr:hypothetical protein F5050DRAFT_1809393 [Lentinula boryana]
MRSVLAYFTLLGLCSAVLAVPTPVPTSNVSPATATGAASLNGSPSIDTANSPMTVYVELDSLWQGQKLPKPVDDEAAGVPANVKDAIRSVVTDFVHEGRSRLGLRWPGNSNLITPVPVQDARIQILYTHAYKHSESSNTGIGFWGPTLQCDSNIKRCNVMIQTKG